MFTAPIFAFIAFFGVATHPVADTQHAPNAPTMQSVVAGDLAR